MMKLFFKLTERKRQEGKKEKNVKKNQANYCGSKECAHRACFDLFR